MDLKVITIEEAAFYELINKLAQEMAEKYKKPADRWIDGEEAMHLLRITSKTTLQQLRDNGVIR